MNAEGDAAMTFAQLHAGQCLRGLVPGQDVTLIAIEPIDARYRRAVRARGHFPNEAVAIKRLYLVTRSHDRTSGARVRWMTRCKPTHDAFAITFAGRLEKTTHE